MADLGAVQLLCDTSGGGDKQKYDFVLYGGKRGGGLERGQIVIKWPLIGGIY